MQFEEGNIYFNKIIIIQSIPENDKQTGTILFNDTIERRASMEPLTYAKLIDVHSKEEFIFILNKIKIETKNKKILPYIHFETHGSKEGISLSSSEIVSYKDIISILRDINIYSNNNLFISVGACWGGNIQFEVDILKPSPFRGFIGPMDEINPIDLLTTFTQYFTELFISNDLEKAIKLLDIYNDSGITFNHFPAEFIFDKIIEIHKDKFRTQPKLLDEYIHLMVNKLWDNDPRFKVVYQRKSKFLLVAKKTHYKKSSLIYNKLRERFLHIQV